MLGIGIEPIRMRLQGIMQPLHLPSKLGSLFYTGYLHAPLNLFADAVGIEPTSLIRPTVFKTASRTNDSTSIMYVFERKNVQTPLCVMRESNPHGPSPVVLQTTSSPFGYNAYYLIDCIYIIPYPEPFVKGFLDQFSTNF